MTILPKAVCWFNAIPNKNTNGIFHRTWTWKRSVFIPIPKKGNTKECSNYHTIALISHASKVMIDPGSKQNLAKNLAGGLLSETNMLGLFFVNSKKWKQRLLSHIFNILPRPASRSIRFWKFSINMIWHESGASWPQQHMHCYIWFTNECVHGFFSFVLALLPWVLRDLSHILL